MKLLSSVLLVIASLPLHSFAQSSAFWDVNSQRRPAAIPAIRILKPAEVLSADVTIVATSRNSSEHAIAFNSALELFHAEIVRSPNVSIKLERTEQGGGAPSYLSSGKFDTNRSVAELGLQISLQGGLDSTGAARALRGLMSRVKLPSDVAVKIEALRVEVRDPDSLRESLLKAISEDSDRIKSLFKSTPVRVTGLEGAVQQQPLNDREVIAFIPYTLSIGGD